MSYQVLARKWRPRSFAEMVGQGHVVKALSHALNNDALHPAILLSGTRGVGKTTLARIIAKALNCEQGVSATPCGECSACREIDAGRFIDLFEVDAASQTKVDETRELLEQVAYSPARGRYKLYLIDEVHMLSNSSFNAMLKTLEEPPAHAKFVLATTDPQKLPVTVLSRCLQFHLRRLPLQEIAQRMAMILAAEHIEFEAPALTALARAAQGSLRDALSLLDQAIAFAGGQVTAAAVETMLGDLPETDLLALLQHLAAQDGGAALALLDRMDQQAPDYERLLDGLSGLLMEIAREQQLGARAHDGDAAAAAEDQPGLAERQALARSMSAEDVQLYYQIVINGKRDLPWAPEPRAAAEMTLLRMLAFHFAGRPATLPATSQTAVPISSTQRLRHARPQAAAARQEEPQIATLHPATAGAMTAGSNWEQLLGALPLSQVDLQLLRQSVCETQAADRLVLRFPAELAALLTDKRRLSMQQGIACHLGDAVRVEFIVGELDAGVETPAARAQREDIERQSSAHAAIAADPVVQALQARMGAQIAPESIKPLTPAGDAAATSTKDSSA